MHNIVQFKNLFDLFLIFDFLFALVLDNDPAGVNSENNIFDIVSVFKLSAWVRTFNEGALTVSQLSYLVVAPEHEGSEVVVGHAVSPSTRNVINHQCCIRFVKEIRQILNQS